MSLVDRLKVRLGILGGGQLAWMLAMKSQNLGYSTDVLCPSSQEPAAQINSHWIQGLPDRNQDLIPFSKPLQVMTFESEFYDSAILKGALKNYEGYIFPSLSALSLLQDRLPQKQSLVESKLATSPFLHSTNRQKILQFHKAHSALVAKKRRNGYDGYGTFVLKTTQAIENFLKENAENLEDFIFEKFIPFEKEMALQVARSRSGDVQFFPMVTTVQKQNKCFYVTGPEKTPSALQKKIATWLHKIDYVGVMGVEFFQTKEGLIINEIAPRVHNTGHHTLDSCNVDQFTMHWLCALQDTLPKVELRAPAFVMLNLLGSSDKPVIFPQESSGSLYWYRKSNRSGRKLGHINWTGKNKKALIHKALTHLKLWKL